MFPVRSRNELVECVPHLPSSSLSGYPSRYQEEEVQLPSDISLDYHPNRTCEYFFQEVEMLVTDELSLWEDPPVEWVLDNGTVISSKCKLFKGISLKKKSDPGSLSDIRIL